MRSLGRRPRIRRLGAWLVTGAPTRGAVFALDFASALYYLARSRSSGEDPR